LSCEIPTDNFGAPSMRRKAFRSPLSSETATPHLELEFDGFLGGGRTAFSAVSASIECLTLDREFAAENGQPRRMGDAVQERRVVFDEVGGHYAQDMECARAALKAIGAEAL
jgi:hypothetical protein